MFAFDISLSRGHAAIRGLLAAALGAACVFWPGITIGVVVLLFAVYCFTDAVAQIAHLFGSEDTGGQRVLMVVFAVIDVAAGVVAISYPGITAAVLVIVIGIWAIVGGTLEIAAAWGGAGSGWFAVGGLLSVIAGILLIVWPGIGAFSLALVFGIYLLVYGITLLMAAIITPSGDTVDAMA